MLATSQLVEASAFTEAMSFLLAGVSVVTASSPSGLVGTTITSFVSISADPPTIMMSLNRTSRTYDVLKENQHFSVNVLSGSQEEIAQRFANPRLSAAERFALTEIELVDNKFPHISGALANFDCELIKTEQIATHAVFFARVRQCHSVQYGHGLAHYRRQTMSLSLTACQEHTH